ncbi:MAG: hypothetical protein K2I69_05265 [Muribaculaceae bacterium]|nr:hypothetical protein [Muribaculaceae bacterium]
MKKLVLMLAVVFSMSFFACGNKEAAAETTEAPEVVEEVVAEEEAPACQGDSCCADTTVAVAEGETVAVAE